MQEVVGVDRVHDIDVVSFVGQRMAEPVQIHRVAAETVRRVERREVQELESAHDVCTVSISGRAVRTDDFRELE